MRDIPGWLIIFDNVKNFGDILDHFPNEHKGWGTGDVIITTNDSHIANHQNINSDQIISVKELSPDEKLELFNKIGKRNSGTSHHDIPKVQKLLQDLPSFPLDIALAAHFIKNRNITCEEYTEHLKKLGSDFTDDQRDLLRNNHPYRSSRFDILKNILSHQDVGDLQGLLLFLSLLKSECIPIALLSLHQRERDLQKGIDFLESYALLHINPGVPSTVSLHRSIQKSILFYLKNNLTQSEYSRYINAVSNTLERYLENLLKSKSKKSMGSHAMSIRSFIPHLLLFLSHGDLLPDLSRLRITHKLAKIYFYLGQYHEADEILTNLLSTYNAHNPEYKYLLLSVERDLGHTLIFLRRYAEARFLLERNLAFQQKCYGKDHIEIASVEKYLGHTYTKLGQYKQAQTLLEHSLQVHQKFHGKDHIETALVEKYLCYPYLFLGDYENARKNAEHSLQIHRKKYGDDDIRTAWVKTNLGRVYTHLGRYDEATILLESSLRTHEENNDFGNIEIAWVKIHLARVYAHLGRYEESKILLESSLSIHQKLYQPDHIKISWVKAHLGRLYIQLGSYKEAKILLENSLKIYQKHYGDQSIETAWIQVHLGRVYAFLGRSQESRFLLENSLQVYVKHYGDKHDKTDQVRKYLKEL